MPNGLHRSPNRAFAYPVIGPRRPTSCQSKTRCWANSRLTSWVAVCETQDYPRYDLPW